ncbi:MAG: 16S rRNA (cytosine(967)-C(5))-methyltransferase RsmB, partial [Desulfobacteraceae bacterium]|nr:16S rRNA (cytosine(967)-C(5))-methyltransferase RsmB [Desulfobacteraceae bacterium]
MTKDPRNIALEILLLCQQKKQTLDQSLDANDKVLTSLSKRDRSLCNAIVFGVLRHRETLDFYIRAFSKTDFKKITPQIKNLLRIGLFQTIYMDRIPVSAAVNTSVNIAKKRCDKKSGGFVNAVLRNACANYADIPLPDPKKDFVTYLSVCHSLPLWLAKKWVKAYGLDQTESLLKIINTPPPITVRTNLLKIDRKTLLTKLESDAQNLKFTKHSQLGISFSNPSCPIHEFKTFQSGFFQIQDEAAQLVTQILDPKPGEKILDACAGLGGKTGHIAQLMENQGSVFAVDVDPEKLQRLMVEIQRLGFDIVETRTQDLLKTSSKDFHFFF